mmetsp:Transcript_72432/g.223820  ORF Transcript_72432/g.223820 Transcript_72432/m.223820 type:complete len:397 (+) Transcript_72432:835-2025(+)
MQLEASLAGERDLQSQLAALGSDVEGKESEARALSGHLSVSEGKAEELRRQLGTLEVRERTLQMETGLLKTRLAAIEGETSELQGRLHQYDGAQEVLRGQSSVASELLMDEAAEIELAESEMRKMLAAELEAQRAAAGRRQADLESALAAATERHSLAEAELERLAVADHSSAPEGPTPTAVEDDSAEEPPVCAKGEASAPVVEAPAERAGESSSSGAEGATAQAAGAPVENGRESVTSGAEEVVVHTPSGVPHSAPIPSLVFVSDTACGNDEPDDPQGGWQSSTAPLPAKCQINLAGNELCLQGLAPLGPLHIVPLDSILSAARPESPAGSVVELELGALLGGAGAGAGLLRLSANDAHAASALLGALSLPNRVPPGFALGPSLVAPPGEVAADL